jgi:hypothetical protein
MPYLLADGCFFCHSEGAQPLKNSFVFALRMTAGFFRNLLVLLKIRSKSYEGKTSAACSSQKPVPLPVHPFRSLKVVGCPHGKNKEIIRGKKIRAVEGV